MSGCVALWSIGGAAGSYFNRHKKGSDTSLMNPYKKKYNVAQEKARKNSHHTRTKETWPCWLPCAGQARACFRKVSLGWQYHALLGAVAWGVRRLGEFIYQDLGFFSIENAWCMCHSYNRNKAQ